MPSIHAYIPTIPTHRPTNSNSDSDDSLPLEPPSPTYTAHQMKQRQRVAEAKERVLALKNSKAANNNANNEAQPATRPTPPLFHDKETILSQISDIASEYNILNEEGNALTIRLNDSSDKVEQLRVKKVSLVNFKGVDGGGGVDLTQIRDKRGNGRVKFDSAKPKHKNQDSIDKQLNTLQLQLLNKELTSTLPSLQKYAESTKHEAALLESKANELKSRVETLPKSSTVTINELKTIHADLLQHKLTLERTRDTSKLHCSKSLATSNLSIVKLTHLIDELRNELIDARADLKYWAKRVRFEGGGVDGVMGVVDGLKERLIELARSNYLGGEGEGGGESKDGDEGLWITAIIKAAFIQGLNTMSSTTSPRSPKNRNMNTNAHMINKLPIRRIPEICRQYIYPAIKNVSLTTIKAVCKDLDIWLNEDDDEEEGGGGVGGVGASLIGEDDFFKLIKGLSELGRE